jgi:hypothetical protein
MLREVPNSRQVPGEPRRRCFFSHRQDLWVWLGDDGAPVAFQLAYGKYRDEHAIRWKAGKGFVHERVDDGESAGVIKQAPILVEDGPFRASSVVDQFLAESSELPRDIADFVLVRLREHPEFLNPAADSAEGP